RFDRTTPAWFLDDTPPKDKTNGANGNEEFAAAIEVAANLGTPQVPITVNISRSRMAPNGMNVDATDRIALFSVALHEIGHALNVTAGAMPPAMVIVTKNRGGNNKNATIEMVGGVAGGGDEGYHLDPNQYAKAVMVPAINASERRTLAGVDVLI